MFQEITQNVPGNQLRVPWYHLMYHEIAENVLANAQNVLANCSKSFRKSLKMFQEISQNVTGNI